MPSSKTKFPGTPFTSRHYVPILKGKRAEIAAISKLKRTASITPLWEVVPGTNGSKLPSLLEKNGWPSHVGYFLDFLYVDSSAHISSVIATCLSQASAAQQKPIPVTGTGRSSSYQQAIRDATHPHGIAIRLEAADFDDPSTLAQALKRLLQFQNASYADADLIVDLGSMANQSASTIAQIGRANLSFVPHLEDWRTLTVVSGSFPKSLGPLTTDIWNSVTRSDWGAWTLLTQGPTTPKRAPTFGDYTVANTELPPAGRATILAQLRYSTPSGFLIWKGRNVQKDPVGFNQFLEICRKLVRRSEFSGPSFSWADAEIKAKATTGGSPGNSQTWRSLGVNHHIEMVLSQIATLP